MDLKGLGHEECTLRCGEKVLSRDKGPGTTGRGLALGKMFRNLPTPRLGAF